jgi:uncharacterized protein
MYMKIINVAFPVMLMLSLTSCGEPKIGARLDGADLSIDKVVQRAEQGSAEAQAILGMAYRDGEGVPKDDAQAITWFRKSAEQGNARAQGALGKAYLEGNGVTRDVANAVVWLLKAVEQGDAEAQVELGHAYRQGAGVPQDYAKAMNLFRKAADQGYARAFKSIAYLYQSGDGVPADAAQYVHWLTKACDLGDAYSCYMLFERFSGSFFGHVDGEDDVPIDAPQAAMWVSKAAILGHAPAQGALAGMYFRGEGVPQDFVLAYAWLNLAAVHYPDDKDVESSRDKILGKLSPTELAEAQRLSSKWQKHQAIQREKK